MKTGKKWLGRILLFLVIALFTMPLGASAASKIDIREKKAISVTKGKSYILTLEETEGKITWKTSKRSVVTVNKNGKITAKKKGTAVITAKVGTAKYQCKVTVKQPVTKVKLNKKSYTMTQGKSYTLKASVSPSSASNKKVTWSTSNKNVATVDAKGKVKAVGAGTATITAKANDGSGKKASCKITVKAVVKKAAVMKISKTALTLEEGTSSTLTVSSTDGAKVAWGSSDRSVASVSSTGKVTAVKAGTAMIAARKTDGSQTVYCKVTVKAAKKTASNTSVSAQKFLAVLEKYSKQIQSDYAAGIKWTYSNSGVANTFNSAVSSGKRKINCALLPRWGLRELGIIDSKNFWGVTGGGITFRGDVKEQLLKHCEIIPVYKTPNQLLAEGNLLPGDICTYVEYQHTNVYAGNGLWYDSGRGVNYSNGVFKSLGPAAAINMSGTTIGHIIRIVK